MDWPLRMRNLFFVIFILTLVYESHAFKRAKLKLGKVEIKIDVAKKTKDLQKGMMFKTSWGDIEGMLFVFPKEGFRSFWMKNTFLPLSIGFFDKKKVLLEVYDLKESKSMTQKNFDSVKSKTRAKYVLEVPKGWFKENNVQIGDAFKFID